MAISRVVVDGSVFTSDGRIYHAGEDGQEIHGKVKTRSSADMVVDGPMVTAPAGLYPVNASKSVATAEQGVPAISVDPETGTVTASVIQEAGYVSRGIRTASTQLPIQEASVIEPTEAYQVVVEAGKYTTGEIHVSPISPYYVGSDVPRRSSADLSVSGTTVIVPAGFYDVSAEVEASTDYVVKFTLEDGTWTANRTFAEISAAYNDGKAIITKFTDIIPDFGPIPDYEGYAINGFLYPGPHYQPFYRAVIAWFHNGHLVYTEYTIYIDEQTEQYDVDFYQQ